MTLAIILLVSAFGAFVGAVMPMSPGAPVTLNAWLAVTGIVLTAIVWTSRQRLWQYVGALAVAGGVTSIVAVAATPAGAAGVSISYAWLALYAGAFFPRWVARAYVVLIAVGMGAALAYNPFLGAANVWVLTVLTVAVAAEVISRMVGRLQASAHSDALTGALNRRGLMQTAENTLERAKPEEPTTVVAIDLDGFKGINDRGGHAAGDELLVELVNAWRGALRSRDSVGRIGGDEFVVLLPGTTREAAEYVVARLRAVSPTGWSCGYATGSGASALDALLREADEDLYRVKRLRTCPSPS